MVIIQELFKADQFLFLLVIFVIYLFKVRLYYF